MDADNTVQMSSTWIRDMRVRSSAPPHNRMSPLEAEGTGWTEGGQLDDGYEVGSLEENRLRRIQEITDSWERGKN